jgi:hypothetical protein
MSRAGSAVAGRDGRALSILPDPMYLSSTSGVPMGVSRGVLVGGSSEAEARKGSSLMWRPAVLSAVSEWGGEGNI